MSNHAPTASSISSKILADVDRHNEAAPDPVPMPEDGGHAHSAAAHLGKHVEGNTRPADNQHPGTTRDQGRTGSR